MPVLVDYALLVAYALAVAGVGLYSARRMKSGEEFMVAGRRIPAWAAGLAVMSAYTSSISYIATPGKAFDTNWHPLIFALCGLPAAWFVTRYIIPLYWRVRLISVYSFLEDRLGAWARVYAAASFLLYMLGRMAVILYLSALLLAGLVPQPIGYLILAVGVVTVFYTLLGGMEAVVWTDVLQSVIMIGGILFCVVFLSHLTFAGDPAPMALAWQQHKFSLGSLQFSFTSRTVWVMILYGLTENLRNLMADQNYVQKYASVPSLAAARRSVWTAMLIYLPLTALFLYVGTALYAYYSTVGLPPAVVKGDQVFPHFIATRLPAGIKGLMIAAILAAAMSTLDSALNCSATVSYLDFYRRFRSPSEESQTSVSWLRWATVAWGFLGTAFALLMVRARSALDVWWTISGIFGGGFLGIFVVALLRPGGVRASHGLVGIVVSLGVISWGTFARHLPPGMEWAECRLDTIIVGAVAAFAFCLVTLALSWLAPEPVRSAKP
ncbi:MAG: sodium:solute symporter [candidate division KSB1 bacterium]|nr:sodium:solute symporter [candidate division KSB1 bacterium]